MTEWKTHFQEVPYFAPLSILKTSHVLLEQIMMYADKSNDYLLEVGAGTGFLSFVLSFQFSVVALDLEVEAIKRWKKFGRLEVVRADVFHLPFQVNAFRIVYSQGLLEHFDGCDVDTTLREQARVADVVIFEVPSEKWVKAKSSSWCFGDENWRSLHRWEKLIDQAELQLLGRYGWGFLSKYRVLSKVLPSFLWSRIHPFFANVLGFVCIGN